MPLLKITDATRANKFCVVVNSVEELVAKANEKGINGSLVVLEEDGTLVDEDIVVKELDKNTLVMILNAELDIWQPATSTANMCTKDFNTTNGNKKVLTTSRDNCMRLSFEGGNLNLRKPTKEEIAAYQAKESLDIDEKAKIYGRTSNKPLTKYQVAVNEAASVIAMEDPIVVLNRGDLMNKAKLKVMSDGYVYAKGKSRSKSGSEPESSSPPNKRAKLSSEERSREIKLLQENLKTLNSRLHFKQQQLEKERCISNYKQCDAISAAMIEIRMERVSVDKQLSALVKKEAKSAWYHKKSTKVVNESKGKHGLDNQAKIPGLLKKSSSSSSGTDDTLLSESSVDNENTVVNSEEQQLFCQTPPTITMGKSTQNM